MLVTLQEILKMAEEKNMAVGSFNATNYDTLRAVIGAAEEMQLPVIIQFAQCHECYAPIEDIAPMMLQAAKKASVPVCVHLDHGETLEYLEKALALGFTGIMYDGSTLPYEENLENTKKAVQMAKKAGAGIEAELGSMGRRESGMGEKSGEDDDTKIYTDPVLARQFVKETGIDALACSFGTTHGIYLTKPRLDFSVVENVREMCDGIPVVMHGGSGVSDENFRTAIKAGVRKINYFTYMDKAGGSGLKAYMEQQKDGQPIFYMDATMKAVEFMKENVKQAMSVFANR